MAQHRFEVGDQVGFYRDENENPHAAVIAESGYGVILGYDGDHALIQVSADEDDSKGLSFTFNFRGETVERKSKLIRVREDKVEPVPFATAPLTSEEKVLIRHLQQLHGLKPTIF